MFGRFHLPCYVIGAFNANEPFKGTKNLVRASSGNNFCHARPLVNLPVSQSLNDYETVIFPFSLSFLSPFDAHFYFFISAEASN